MTRIGSNAPGNIQPQPLPKIERGEQLFVKSLPEELPPPSHTKLSSLDLAKLILPEEMDLSLISKDHPLHEEFNQLWLETTLRAIVAGGEHSKASLPPTPPME